MRSIRIQLCNGIGYKEWFLPSKDELNLIYTNKITINTTATAKGDSIFSDSFYNFYRSSTKSVDNRAWEQVLGNGDQIGRNKKHHMVCACY